MLVEGRELCQAKGKQFSGRDVFECNSENILVYIPSDREGESGWYRVFSGLPKDMFASIQFNAVSGN